MPPTIWECAAGRGDIVQVLRAHDYTVIASDLVNYGFPLDFTADFVQAESAPPGCEAILTNPPGQCADDFVRRAIALVPTVVMLLPLRFLASTGRTDILEQSGLARFYVFRNRLPMMHRAGWPGPKASSAIDFAWFIWERGYSGRPEMRRVSWDASAAAPVENERSLDEFGEHAEARAHLWAAGESTLREAVNGLQADAERSGLVEAFGQDRIQEVMAQHFAPYRKRGP